MAHTVDPALDAPFVERRGANLGSTQRERRQFVDGHEELSPEGRELANAIDGYKLRHRRRFISHDELLGVISSLGYQK